METKSTMGNTGTKDEFVDANEQVVYIYARISDSRQTSLQSQVDICTNYIETNLSDEYKIKVITEECSGRKLDDMMQLKKLLNIVRQNGAHIVMMSPSRLSRNVDIFKYEYLLNSCTLHFVEPHIIVGKNGRAIDMAKFQSEIIAAKLSSDKLSDTMKAYYKEKRKIGIWNPYTTPPFGFRIHTYKPRGASSNETDKHYLKPDPVTFKKAKRMVASKTCNARKVHGKYFNTKKVRHLKENWNTYMNSVKYYELHCGKGNIDPEEIGNLSLE